MDRLHNIKTFTRIKEIFCRSSKPVPLGRWNYHKSEIKANMANLDNCGDKICGSPEVLKQTYKSSNISQDKSKPLDIDTCHTYIYVKDGVDNGVDSK